MSHQVEITLGNFEAKILAKAFNSLGWKTTETKNSATERFVAKNPTGYYDIRAVEEKGNIGLKHDSDIRFAETTLGADFKFLKQQYQVEKAGTKGKVKRDSLNKATGVRQVVVEVYA